MHKTVLASLLVIAGVLLGAPAHAEPPEPKVKLLAGSVINLVARESSIPIAVQNDYDFEVRVRVKARSASPKVIVEQSVELVIPAATTVNAQIPVRAIANGEARVYAWLTTFTDIRLGKNIPIDMVVNADLELIAIVIFGSGIVVLVVVGLIRTRLRHGRSKRGEAQ